MINTHNNCAHKKDKQMKKILSLLLVVVIAIGALAGCSSKSVSKADLEANPQLFIEEGFKISLSKSPFGSIIELKEPEATSINVAINPENKDLGYAKLNAIIANNKLSALAELDCDFEGEKINGKIFVDKENIALQFAELKEFFGTDSIGIGLKDIGENFKKSGWYQLIKDSGLEDEFKSEMEAEGLDKIDFDAVVKAYEKYYNDLQSSVENCKKYTVKESTREKVKGFEVEETISEDIVSELDKIFNTFAEDVTKAMGFDKEALGFESMPDEIKDEFKKIIGNYYTTYFIAQKTGALLEVKTNVNIEIEDEDAYYFGTINFGDDPTKMFQPSFDLEFNDGSESISIKGDSEINVKEKSFTMNVNCDAGDEDVDIKLIIDKDSNFDLNVSADEETIKLSGLFKVDGPKLNVKIDDAEVEDDEKVDIEVNIDFNAKTPVSFEYDNLLDYNKEKVEDLIEKFNESIGGYSPYEDEMSELDFTL